MIWYCWFGNVFFRWWNDINSSCSQVYRRIYCCVSTTSCMFCSHCSHDHLIINFNYLINWLLTCCLVACPAWRVNEAEALKLWVQMQSDVVECRLNSRRLSCSSEIATNHLFKEKSIHWASAWLHLINVHVFVSCLKWRAVLIEMIYLKCVESN